MANYDPEFDEAVEAESREKLEKPPLFKVLLHNDDFTTMEFVVHVLQTVFGHEEAAAVRIMLNVHTQGTGVAGVYTYEVAETKAEAAARLARAHEYPLLCTVEQE